jgi:hypothetical protein
MDQAKLEALRTRYQDASIFEAEDPIRKEAIRGMSPASGRRVLPYSGIPTLLGLPYVL